VPTLLDLVTVHGPWIIFLLAVLETSFITGIIVPSGVAMAIATGIALEEGASVLPVAAAALAGGALGDTLGFWIGRAGRSRWRASPGGFARRVRFVQERSADYLSGRPFLSVTIARMVSFVRTVMPMAAGMSNLPYLRFLPYELLGLAMWCAFYVVMGAGAGQGWMWVIRLFDLWVLAVGAVAVGALFWYLVRRRSATSKYRSPAA
jgi:membrane-associated protein